MAARVIDIGDYKRRHDEEVYRRVLERLESQPCLWLWAPIDEATLQNSTRLHSDVVEIPIH